MTYSDPILTKYIDTLKAANTDIKMYYQGEPFRIPASYLPAVFISKTDTNVASFTNAEDEHQIGLRLTLVTDVREELDNEKDIVAGIARLYDIMEGRDSDYSLKTTSILHILRTNMNLDTANNLRTDLSTTTRIDYSETLNRRNNEAWFVEANISYIAHFLQTR